jgi:hypothetical protein
MDSSHGEAVGGERRQDQQSARLKERFAHVVTSLRDDACAAERAKFSGNALHGADADANFGTEPSIEPVRHQSREIIARWTP